jgi:TonB family protein
LKQWFFSLIIIGVAHGAILFSPSSLFVGDDKFVLAYHQGEEAGIKYRVSLISKRPQKEAPRPKKRPDSVKSQNNTKAQDSSPSAGARSTPKMVGKFAPPYHRAAKRRLEQGDVTIAFTLGPDGYVTSASIKSSSGHSRLDRSALTYIKQQKFIVTQIGGSAVQTTQELTISYRVQ